MLAVSFLPMAWGPSIIFKGITQDTFFLTRPHLLEFEEPPQTVPPVEGIEDPAKTTPVQTTTEHTGIWKYRVHLQASVYVMQGLMDPGLPWNSLYN